MDRSIILTLLNLDQYASSHEKDRLLYDFSVRMSLDHVSNDFSHHLKLTILRITFDVPTELQRLVAI